MKLLKIFNEIHILKHQLLRIDLNNNVLKWLEEHKHNNNYCNNRECPHSYQKFMEKCEYWPNNHTCTDCLICDVENYCKKDINKIQSEIDELEEMKVKKIQQSFQNLQIQLDEGNKKVIIFDIDGTLTPHAGQEINSLFNLSWCCYVKKYVIMNEIKYISNFLNKLIEKDFIIVYASRGHREDILELFGSFGINNIVGIAREDEISKEDFINLIIKNNKNEYYYFEDDIKYINNVNNLNNVYCGNNMWFGKQLSMIYKNEYIDEINSLYNFIKKYKIY